MRAATTAPSRDRKDDATGDPKPRPLLNLIKRSTLARTIAAYGSAQTGNYAAGLAYNAFMSMFPLILGILAVLGLVLGDPSLQRKAQATIVSAFPSATRADMAGVVAHLPDTAGIFAVLAIAGLLWTGTNFFSSLEFALGKMFDIGQRSFLRQRAMGVVMLLVLVVALVAAVAANTLMALVTWMTGAGPVAGFAILVGLMLAIYRYVPMRSFAFRDIWPGAVVAGLLIEAITLLFPLYGKLVHGYNAYGQGLALFFLLATWMGFLSQFILIGALWNRVRLGKRFSAPGLAARPLENRDGAARPGAGAADGAGRPRSDGGGAAPA